MCVMNPASSSGRSGPCLSSVSSSVPVKEFGKFLTIVGSPARGATRSTIAPISSRTS